MDKEELEKRIVRLEGEVALLSEKLASLITERKPVERHLYTKEDRVQQLIHSRHPLTEPKRD
ncbi:Hypothetical protein BRZCDTV_80 [Brazilian cedratvirus IHUMI]|uniref:Uncharacterized protein n=1 Tax=Brazilian cedratvirus IHUMI TaxID=2126980 RepID=A0A2R8FD54_9VIRU|nr:Hypothetical protein BRZCDTV_80 [Brazilian cedratvirus IHUMI]